MKFFNIDTLMMPTKYLQDLKKASLDSLSFNVSFSNVNHRYSCSVAITKT